MTACSPDRAGHLAGRARRDLLRRRGRPAARRGVRGHAPAAAAPGRGRRCRCAACAPSARQPGWLAGLALAGSGTALHAVALVLAPLSVVQPVGVLAVPIAVLLTAVRARRTPGGAGAGRVALPWSAVAAFVVTAAGTAVSSPPPDGATLVAALVVAGGGRRAGRGRAGPLRLGPLRGLRDGRRGGLRPGVRRWSGRCPSRSPPALAGAARPGRAGRRWPASGWPCVVGGWLVQQAFASGPPEVVIACLTVVDPIVAVHPRRGAARRGCGHPGRRPGCC